MPRSTWLADSGAGAAAEAAGCVLPTGGAVAAVGASLRRAIHNPANTATATTPSAGNSRRRGLSEELVTVSDIEED
jgi:hypothetical protein